MVVNPYRRAQDNAKHYPGICPFCERLHLRSRVHSTPVNCTRAEVVKFLDGDGKVHLHDSNIAVSSHKCERDHTWRVRTSGVCWCGWKGKLKSS